MTDVVAIVYRGVRFFESGPARKRAVCWHCDRPIAVGQAVFRPLYNGSERMRRLCIDSVEALVDGGCDHLKSKAKQ